MVVAIPALVYTFVGGLFASTYTNIFQVYSIIGTFRAVFIFVAASYTGVDLAKLSQLHLLGTLTSCLSHVANDALIN